VSESTQRHPGDAIRVALGLFVLLIAWSSVRDRRVGLTEADLFQLVNQLPSFFVWPFETVMQLGTGWAIAGTTAVALAARRLRLARDLAVSGLVAWGLAHLLKGAVSRARPSALLHHVIIRGAHATGAGFPSGHTAVVTALATAASPYLPRPLRRAVWLAVVIVGVARVYVGAHLPVDVFGGAAVGWVVGSLVHLAFGAPGGRPARAGIEQALTAVHQPVTDLTPLDIPVVGGDAYAGHLTDGTPVTCIVIGRDQRDADTLYKLWRLVATREQQTDTDPFARPGELMEHAGYVSLLAARAGVRTPDVLLTTGFNGGALLLEHQAGGPRLAEMTAAAIDDRLLDAVWAQAKLLHDAHISHHALNADNIVVGSSGEPWLIGFRNGDATASDQQLAIDVVELLTSLAVIVGPDRAVASAARVLGADALKPALPLMQPIVLTPITRKEARHHKALIEHVREQVATAAGTTAPKIEPLTRIKPSSLVMVAVIALTARVLLPQFAELGNASHEIVHANPGWVLAGLLASIGVFLAGGVAQLGAVKQRLLLLRTTLVQLAAAFTNRLTPSSIGGLAVRTRFLQRSGLDREAAVAGTALDSLGGGIVHGIGLIVAIVLAGGSGFGAVPLPTGWPLLAGIVAVLTLIGLAIFTPRIRHALAPAKRALVDLGQVMRVPSKAMLLLGGSAAGLLCYLLAFEASLQAVGAHVGIRGVFVVYLGGTTIAAPSPTPGGLGAVEAALIAGLTALGTASAPAVAGVLVFRLLTYWLPILPGYLSLLALRRESLL
jgi:glycosyltransferase 2 family protein